MQTWGSEGDIRPFLALAGGLASSGHDVRLVLTELDDREYQRYASQLGFKLEMVGSPVLSSTSEMTAAGEAILEMSNAFQQGRFIAEELFEPGVPAMFAAARDLARWSDVMVRHYFHYPAAVAAQLEQIPDISVSYSPDAIPSADQPPGDLRNFGALTNRMLWWLAQWALDRTFLPPANRLREREGLDPVARTVDSWYSERLNLLAVSPSLRPASVDWAARHRVTGFFNVEDGARFDPVPAPVQAFLNEGRPPIFVGFGSLTPKDRQHREETLNIVRNAIGQADCRAIVQGLAEPGQENNTLMHVARVPHAAVFGRCAGVVHHAGAGTTQTALAAGVPSICIPHLADQFYWSRRLYELGVAARPLRRTRFTASRLAGRIATTLQAEQMREAAARLGARLSKERGVETAVRLIEQSLEDRPLR